MNSDYISTKSSLKWAGIGQASKVLTQIGGILVLARLLPPEDFGLMALAATVTAFASLFRDMGSGAALIQKDVITAELKNAVYFFNLILGIILTILLLFSAKVISLIFNEPNLEQVLVILSPVFLIVSISTTHLALLERDSAYKKIALINIVASFVGLCVAIYIALSGGGVYALVGQSISSAFVTSVLLWFTVRWLPRLSFRFNVLKEIFSFSSNLFIFDALNYFHRNLDSMLIGRFLGTQPLGLYNIAYKILLFPLHNITFVVGRVMFPAYSRVQHDNSSIAYHYLNTLKIIAFLTAPMMACVWYFRDTFILVLLGKDWLPAAGVLAWLAPVGFFQSLVSTSGAVLKAKGRTDILRNLGFIGVPFLTLSFFIGLPWGIEGIAASYCIANLIWLFPVMKITFGVLETRIIGLLTPIIKITLMSLFSVIITFLFDDLLTVMVKYGSLTYLLLGVFIFLIIYILGSTLFYRNDIYLVMSVLRRRGN